jgi:hypothetical protein
VRKKKKKKVISRPVFIENGSFLDQNNEKKMRFLWEMIRKSHKLGPMTRGKRRKPQKGLSYKK